MPNRPARPSVLAVMLLATAFVGAPAHADDAAELRLRVLSLNCWGIPLDSVAPMWDRRAKLIGEAIARLQPDVAGLQEVWFPADAEKIADLAGLPHRAYFQEPGRSGLLVLSRFPIESRGLDLFKLNGAFLYGFLGHADWIAGKGVATARLRTPLGPLPFLTTHTVSSHPPGSRAGDRFIPHRLTEADQIVRAVERARVSATGGEAVLPAILTGDLNAEPDSPEVMLVKTVAGLADTVVVAPRIDYVLVGDAPGFRLGLRERRVEELGEIKDDAGRAVPISDHPYVLVDMVIRRADAGAGTTETAAVMPTGAEREATRRAARGILEADLQSSIADQLVAGAVGVVALLVAAAAWMGARRRPARWLRLALRGVAALFVVVGAVAAGYALVTRPEEIRILRALHDALG